MIRNSILALTSMVLYGFASDSLTGEMLDVKKEKGQFEYLVKRKADNSLFKIVSNKEKFKVGEHVKSEQ